jgi:hypothetical protein
MAITVFANWRQSLHENLGGFVGRAMEFRDVDAVPPGRSVKRTGARALAVHSRPALTQSSYIFRSPKEVASFEVLPGHLQCGFLVPREPCADKGHFPLVGIGASVTVRDVIVARFRHFTPGSFEINDDVVRV